MGDILHALPAITALRLAHPGWIIDWVIEPTWRALFSAGEALSTIGRTSAQPLVDRLHLAPTKAWRRQPLAPETRLQLAQLRRDLKTAQYDAVLDLQGAIRSAVVSRLTGCRRRIGEAHPRESAARWLFTERIVTTRVHVIEQDMELASAVAGDLLAPVSPWLPFDPAAEEWTDRFLGSPQSRTIILLNPGAGWGAKRWPVDRYAAVAASLASQGFRIVVNAGPGEENLAQEICARSGEVAEPVASTLAQLIALTRRAALVIAGDTGPLHLACALGRPVVGIYGPTDPSRNGPYGTHFRVLRSPGSRRDHTRRTAPETGLLTIQPAEVLDAAHELLVEEPSA